MFKLIGSLLEEQIEYSVKRAISPLAPYLKRLTSGVVLILIAGGISLFGFLFILVSLFFSLTDTLAAYAVPALWTSASCFGLTVLLAVISSSLLKRPR